MSEVQFHRVRLIGQVAVCREMPSSPESELIYRNGKLIMLGMMDNVVGIDCTS
jgi:hypothetical protein